MSWRVYLTFVTLCLIWGVPYFLIKLALRDLSPACVAWARITLAALILVPIAWRSGALGPVLKHKTAICAFAIAELVIPFSMIAVGEQWVTSSLAGILVATAPLTIVLIAPFFGVHERLGPKRMAGLLIGFSGVIALLGLDIGQDARLWLGVAALMIAVVGYAVGPLIVQRHLAGIEEIGAVAASLVVASFILLPFALASAPVQMPSTLSLVSVAVLGTICTALALLLFFYLIHAAGAARAALVAYVNPAVASLLGVLVLHEPFGVHTVVGLAMILGGSWLASSRGGEEEGVTPENA